MRQRLHSHSGGVVLVWHKKSNMLSHSFQTNHHPITITIKCLSSVTTTTTTTVDISTTTMLCRCQVRPWLLLDLLMQVIANNWLEMLQQRLHVMNRTGGWLPISIKLSFSLASSAAPPLPMLPLATNPPPPLPEPRMAPNQVGHRPTILAIFAVAWLLLSPWQTR